MVCPQCGTQNENRRETCLRCKRSLHPAAMKGKIPCYVHANREATSSCALCGHRLCLACAVPAGGIDYCEGCAPADALRQSYDEDYEKLAVLDIEKVPLANFDSRFFAAVIDIGSILVGAAIIVLALWLFTGGSLDFLRSEKTQPVAYYLLRFSIMLGLPLYLFLPVAMSGQTLGHRVCGVICLQPDGHIVTVRQALYRTLFLIISALPFFLGFAWMIWDKEKLTWHDRISNTRLFEWQANT